MKITLETLWNEYLADQCAVIDTEEERELANTAILLRKTISVLLTKEQSDTVEKYVDVLCELQYFFVKKAFFKGCEFATSFLLQAGNLGTDTKILPHDNLR